MVSSFLNRAAGQVIDFRDPDNLPGMSDLMHNAMQRAEQRSLESAPKWNLIIDKLKATSAVNRKSTGWDAKWQLSFRFKGGHVSIYDRTVCLCFDVHLDDVTDQAAIQGIWKQCGLQLGSRQFITVGNYVQGGFNTIDLEYYSSLAGAEGDKRVKAILKTIAYVRKKAKS